MNECNIVQDLLPLYADAAGTTLLAEYYLSTPVHILERKGEMALVQIADSDVVGWMRWLKNKKKPGKSIYIDAAHLNNKGTYLQGCVWYMVLFNEPVNSIKLPFKDKSRALLLQCADEAVKQYKK